jgi:hypothetical protein
MKKFIILICLSISALVSAQEITKNANTIVITDTICQKNYYSQVNEILFTSGYGIHSADKNSGTITTTPKPIRSGTVKLNILVSDNKVLIRGEFKSVTLNIGGVIDDSPMIIENYGMKRSPLMMAWNEMNNIAIQIPGKKEYLIK